jgi:hypothetical protein
MAKTRRRKFAPEAILTIAILSGVLASLSANAQDPEVQQKLAAVKEASAQNKRLSLLTHGRARHNQPKGQGQETGVLPG